MEKIVIVDTSFVTDNLGDQTIMDAVNDFVWSAFPHAYISRVPSHEPLSDRSRRLIYDADWCFLGGTNLISSHIHLHGLWRIGPEDAKVFKTTRTVSVGVGWGDYEAPPKPATQKIISDVLFPDLIHSTRDSYTRDRIINIGRKCISTSCPTTWSLTPEHCAKIPTRRAPTAIVSLTAWRANPGADRAFIETVSRHYDKVLFFPQMLSDVEYFEKFGFDNINYVAVTNESYTNFLQNEDVDVIGTRLHGGIRAMQCGRRALILAVDNRASEIAKDTRLPVVDRHLTEEIEAWIDGEVPTVLNLPQDAIDKWRGQFNEASRSAIPSAIKGSPPELDRGSSPIEAIRRLKRAATASLGAAKQASK